jgi:hypothetical protein
MSGKPSYLSGQTLKTLAWHGVATSGQSGALLHQSNDASACRRCPRHTHALPKSHHATLGHPCRACAHGGLYHVPPVCQSRVDPFRLARHAVL